MRKIWRINRFIFILVLAVYSINWYINHRDPEGNLTLQSLFHFYVNSLLNNTATVESFSNSNIENQLTISVEDEARMDEINQEVANAIQEAHIANSLANQHPEDVSQKEEAEKAQNKLDQLLSEQENILNANTTNKALPL